LEINRGLLPPHRAGAGGGANWDRYYGFEHATMVPMCKKLTDESLLTPAEKKWLNDYHAEVLEKTKPFLEKDEAALKWLERETAPIQI
jgi:Xaa-Pro aminopeptidase